MNNEKNSRLGHRRASDGIGDLSSQCPLNMMMNFMMVKVFTAFIGSVDIEHMLNSEDLLNWLAYYNGDKTVLTCSFIGVFFMFVLFILKSMFLFSFSHRTACSVLSYAI